MKRMVLFTIGPTHSGKSSFARTLEQQLEQVVVLDQDLQAEFLNAHYEKLVPQTGPNTLKFMLSETLLHYAIEKTSYHLILCNSNIHLAPRQQLLERFFPSEQFVRVFVYFDVTQATLLARIEQTLRDTKLFRDRDYTYEELLQSQLPQIDVPSSDEADYLLTVNEATNVEQLIEEIQMIMCKEIPDLLI